MYVCVCVCVCVCMCVCVCVCARVCVCVCSFTDPQYWLKYFPPVTMEDLKALGIKVCTYMYIYSLHTSFSLKQSMCLNKYCIGQV